MESRGAVFAKCYGIERNPYHCVRGIRLSFYRMTASSVLLVLIVVLNGLAALLACVALLLWLAGQIMGQPITFREAFRGTSRLALTLLLLGVSAFLAWFVLRGQF